MTKQYKIISFFSASNKSKNRSLFLDEFRSRIEFFKSMQKIPQKLSLIRLKLALASYSNLYKTPITIIKLQKVSNVEGSEYDTIDLKFVYFEKATKFEKIFLFSNLCGLLRIYEL